jgi:hypothetical protein
MKGKKLIFAFILALIVCVALIPLCAYADGDEGGEQGETVVEEVVDPIPSPAIEVTEKGGSSESADTVQDAVDKIDDIKNDDGTVTSGVGGEIKLNEDVTVDTAIYVGSAPDDLGTSESPVAKSTCNITIDLGGNTLTSNSGTALVINSGNVTLVNGTVNGYIYTQLSSTLTIGSNVTVNGMVVVYGDVPSGNSRYHADTPTVNIYGTVILDKYNTQAISTNGTDRSGATINVYKNASIWAVQGEGVYLPSGNLNVYGGTIKGWTGIYTKGGTVNIKGGTIIGTLNPAGQPDFNNNNGCASTGTALTIEHSELTTNKQGEIVSAGYPLLTSSQVSISGGKLISEANKAVLVYTRFDQQTPASGFITGGIFSSDPTAIYGTAKGGKDASLVKAGVEVKYIDGLWYVGSSIPVETVEEAVVAVEPVITNTVEAVVEGTSTVSLAANEEVVIKLNLTVAADSTSGEAVEVTSVVVNGVEVEFTIAEDGSVVLSPEVLAALGPGTHTIYILTSEGWVKVTITITE